MKTIHLDAVQFMKLIDDSPWRTLHYTSAQELIDTIDKWVIERYSVSSIKRVPEGCDLIFESDDDYVKFCLEWL